MNLKAIILPGATLMLIAVAGCAGTQTPNEFYEGIRPLSLAG